MYGMQITKPDGSLWLSPEFTPVNLINRGSMEVKLGAIFKTSIPSGNMCFFFVRFGARAFVAFDQIIIDGMHALKIDKVDVKGDSPKSIIVYAFSDMVTPPPKYGIAFYNKSGKMIYHGAMKPLEVKQVNTDTGNLVFDINLGHLAAVTPTMTAAFTVPNPSVGMNDIYVAHAGAVGNTIYSKGARVANNPGTIGISYSTTILAIDASKYD